VKRIDGPRSLWSVKRSRATPSLTTVSRINRSARCFTFAAGQHPADDVAAEDVEDHVQVEVGPFRRPQQLGDVPGPDLIGRGGQQLRLVVGRVSQLVASLADFLPRVQDAVHRAGSSRDLALIQKCRINLGRSLVGKRLAVKHVENLLPLLLAERPRRRGPWRGCGLGRLRRTVPIGASRGARPNCDRPLPCPPAERVLRWLSWLAPVVVWRWQGNPQHLREFFLDLDDRLGLGGAWPPAVGFLA